jgi:asparagine synthase (glutamine-hydrolysing)
MHFVVLPDHPAAVDIAIKMAENHPQVMYHESGRPWIIGSWADDDIVVAAAGTRRLALVGRTSVREEQLLSRLPQLRSATDVDSLSRELAGCAHLIYSSDAEVHVQGTLADVCRVYFATVEGVTVAADRPDELARYKGASLDERLLPLYLLAPYAWLPWPLSERCLWQGVQKVAPAHRLTLEATGGHRIRRWWFPPEPAMSLEEGSASVRSALIEAVRARVDEAGSAGISIDLSGGMDSTSLCYVANHLNIPFSTIHFQGADPSNKDSEWAERCRGDLVTANHLVMPYESVPGAYAESVSLPPEPRSEGPTSIIHPSTIAFIAKHVSQLGARRHLRGDGSDELFRRAMVSTAAMIRRHPVRHWRYLLKLKARGRWNVSTTLRNVRSPGSYRSWLRRTARDLTADFGRRSGAGWELPLRMPPWAAPEAVAAVRSLLLEAASNDVQPLIPDPAQNEMIRLAQLNGEAMRQQSHVGRQFGVSFEAPYVDDQVIEAALAIRPEAKVVEGANKPILAAAMKGIVPQDVLGRRDKSYANRDLYLMLRRNREFLVAMCDEPELARYGLVDADALRRIVLGMHPDLKAMNQFGPTWGVEMWLRGLREQQAAKVLPPIPQYS